MSMKKFRLIADDPEIDITLEVDTTIVTVDLVRECVRFWYGHGELLGRCEGDETQRYFEAYARNAASFLLPRLISGVNPEGAVEDLAQEEGWPANTGIRIDDYNVPQFEPGSFALDVEAS